MQLISHDQTGNGLVRVGKRSGFVRPVTHICFEFLITARPSQNAQLEGFLGELVETLAPMQGISLHIGPLVGTVHHWRLELFVTKGSPAVRTVPEDLLNRLIRQVATQSIDVRHYPCSDQHALRFAG